MSSLSSSSTETNETLSEDSGDANDRDMDMNNLGLMKECNLIVKCKGEEVFVRIFSGDFNFVEFDSWIRSRFGCTSDVKIKYSSESQNEIFLTRNNFNVENLILMVTCNPQLPVQSVPLSKKNSFNFFLFIVTMAAVIVAIGAARIHPIADISLADILMNAENYCLPEKWGLRKGTMADALISFISWSTTYLFIRRLWNPETSPMAFEKFSPDAFYGGLAAAAASILKSMLYASLVKS